MFGKIVVGGTFDGLHKGHESLLSAAFDNGRSVVIGLTSDAFADRFRTRKVRPYAERRAVLEALAARFGKPHSIVEISDSYGVATIDPEIDCIVVSEETLLRAEEINTIRFKKKLPKLTIIVVPLVLDKKGQPLSSTK
jgi:pantetheine-phosphate adenylyltransferase